MLRCPGYETCGLMRSTDVQRACDYQSEVSPDGGSRVHVYRCLSVTQLLADVDQGLRFQLVFGSHDLRSCFRRWSILEIVRAIQSPVAQMTLG